MDLFKVETNYARNAMRHFSALREIHSSFYAEKRIFVEANAIDHDGCKSVIVLVARLDDDEIHTHETAALAVHTIIEAYEVTNEDDLRTILSHLLLRYLTTIDLSV